MRKKHYDVSRTLFQYSDGKPKIYFKPRMDTASIVLMSQVGGSDMTTIFGIRWYG